MNSRQSLKSLPRYQGGAVLVFTLLVLLVLALSAIKLIQAAALEERLTAYLIDKHRTLQVAESALSFAEQVVFDWPDYSIETGSQGVDGAFYQLQNKAYRLYSLNAGEHRWWLDENVWQSRGTLYDDEVIDRNNVLTVYYIIEEYGVINDASGFIVVYRISVRVSAVDQNSLMVQSLFATNKLPIAGTSSPSLGRWLWRQL